IDIGGGTYNSLQIVNGNPAISYSTGYPGSLKYVRATNASGTAWGTPVIIAAVTSEAHTSLEIVNGLPAITYFGPAGLQYVRATDASGSAWAIPVTIDAGRGRYTSLQIVNGNPAVTYFNSSGNLKYVRANDASGTDWGNPDTLYEGSGEYCSMINTSNGAAIAYYNSSDALPYFISGGLLCQVGYWVGNFSSSWENPANWSCGILPDINTNVIINTSAACLLSSSVSVKSVTVNQGSSFSNNGHLNIGP
ncbi:MAG: hypothetical protein ABIS01_17680, partial [Ferruginibacter sp.]